MGLCIQKPPPDAGQYMSIEEVIDLGRRFKGVPDSWEQLEDRDPNRDYDFENRRCISNKVNFNLTWAFRVKRRVDSKYVCIKMQQLKDDNSEETLRINNERLNEARIMEKLNPYYETLTIFDVFKEKEYLFIVSELCQYGDLNQLRKQKE